MISPDFQAWASVEALTPHEIACLSAGMEPTSTGKPPCLPSNIDLEATQEDVSSAYKRVHLILERAITEKKLALTTSGKISPATAVDYLLTTAKTSGWGGWLDGCEFIHAVQQVSSARNEVDCTPGDQQAELIESLKEEIATLKRRANYSTPMLETVYKVIDAFYADATTFPKQQTVFAFVEELPTENGEPWSTKKKEAIWAVASDPSQAKGGQKKLKK